MALKNNEILFTLPEGADKAIMFDTIAKGNGWTPTITKTVEKTLEVTGQEAHETERQRLTSEGKGIIGSTWIDQEAGTISIAYTEEIEIDNISSFDFGKNLAIKSWKELYASSKIKVDTIAEQEAIKQAQEALQVKQKEVLEEAVNT